jgi:hypothetical protein
LNRTVSSTSRQSALLAERTAHWFLSSGIQEPSGGVARYHHISERRNARISTEITGYTVSALLDLHARLGDPALLEAAVRAGRFLCEKAWQPARGVMPFEWSANGDLPENHTYFFDCGIIARGLLRLGRQTGESRYFEVARGCAESMRTHFVNGADIHPILKLPSLEPAPRDGRWSRSSDVYQLKSALAWHEIAQATGESAFEAEYEKALDRALGMHEGFLDRATEPLRVMDRLHAYGYFLEGLLPRAHLPEVRRALAAGIDRSARELRALRASFERSDVCAQILRVRLWANDAGAVALDEQSASEEAAWAASYQMQSADPRLDGGFNFGSRGGALTDFANPVSTAFCFQALAMWEDHLAGAPCCSWRDLI